MGQLVIGILEKNEELKLPASYYVKSQFPDARVLQIRSWYSLASQLEETPIDILMIDVSFDDRERDECVKALEKVRDWFPILVLTRETNDAFLSETVLRCIDDYLVRPIDELILRSKIESLIYGKYVSPFYFFELGEASDMVSMTIRIRLEYLSENRLVFMSQTQFPAGGKATLTLGKVKVPSLVEKCEFRVSSVDFRVECRVSDDLPFADQVEFRRFIFQLMNRGGNQLPRNERGQEELSQPEGACPTLG